MQTIESCGHDDLAGRAERSGGARWHRQDGATGTGEGRFAFGAPSRRKWVASLLSAAGPFSSLLSSGAFSVVPDDIPPYRQPAVFIFDPAGGGQCSLTPGLSKLKCRWSVFNSLVRRLLMAGELSSFAERFREGLAARRRSASAYGRHPLGGRDAVEHRRVFNIRMTRSGWCLAKPRRTTTSTSSILQSRTVRLRR